MFLSTKTWEIFDPRHLITKDPGLTFDLTSPLVKEYSAALDAFRIKEFVGGNIDPLSFDKTIFRLPLREQIDIKEEEYEKIISSNIPSYAEILKLLHDKKFQEKAKKFLLFLNYVKELEFRYIGKGELQSTLIISVIDLFLF